MSKLPSFVAAFVAPLLLAFLAALVTVGMSPAGAVAGVDEEMSKNQAGRYYLDAVCDYNVRGDRYNEVLFPGNSRRLSFAEARRRLPALQRASRVWADAHYRFARKLSNPPAAWPADVQGAVGRFASSLLKLRNLWEKAGYASTAQGWWDWDAKATKLYNRTNVSALIRLRLDLPPPGRGC